MVNKPLAELAKYRYNSKENRMFAGKALAGFSQNDNEDMIDKKIKILHVIWDDDFGGAEKHVLDLVTHLNRSEFDCELCILHEDKDRIAKSVREAGITIHHLNLRSGFDIRGVIRFIRFARRQKYDIIHCHIYPLWIQIAIRLFTRSVSLITLHGRDIVDQPTKRSVLTNRISRKATHAYIAPSMINKKANMELYGLRAERVFVVYHGIDLSEFHPATAKERADKRKELGIPDGCCAIGTIGRLAEQKNYPCFIKASVEIHSVRSNSIFLIVGVGEKEGEIKELIKANGAEKYIKLLGRRTDIPQFLGALDMFMFTSWMESFGIVVAEAMATGLPVVSSNTSSLPEIVGDAGILVSPDNANGFAKEGILLMDDEKRRRDFGERAKVRAVSLFAVDKMISDTARIYKTLLK